MYAGISGRAPVVNGTAIVTVNSLHCGVTYNITAQGMYNNETMAGPRSPFKNITTGVCPSKTHTYVAISMYSVTLYITIHIAN